MSASAFTKIMIATAVITGLVAPVAFAHELSAAGEKTGDDGAGAEVSHTSTTGSQGGEVSGGKVEVTETPEDNNGSDNAGRGGDNATTTGERERGEHRSEVARQVQELLDVADRDEGIGQEVRDVAHEVASSSERAEVEKQDVEGRPGWLTFLIGANFKNLGALRSEVATTQNSIDRLTKARARATSSTTQAALEVQISALKDSASSTEAYVKAHESVFSIFGWFFKLFS